MRSGMLFTIRKNSRLVCAAFLCAGLALFASGCAQEEGTEAAEEKQIVGPDITEPALLVFSKTLEWRHNEGIAGADRYFVGLARDLGVSVFTTVNSAVFNQADLKRFKLIVFNNATGDILSEQEQQAFETWLASGGGWIGIHGAGDGSQARHWPWYQKTLIGPMFISHPMAPQFQEARLKTLAAGHPVLAGIPDAWMHTDEWYTFDGTPQMHGLLPLVGLNEQSYSPVNTVYGDVSDLRMGPEPIDHPIIWAACVGAGRAVYSGLGHQDLSYDQPVPRKILKNAARWVLQQVDKTGTGCPEPEQSELEQSNLEQSGGAQ